MGFQCFGVASVKVILSHNFRTERVLRALIGLGPWFVSNRKQLALGNSWAEHEGITSLRYSRGAWERPAQPWGHSRNDLVRCEPSMSSALCHCFHKVPVRPPGWSRLDPTPRSYSKHQEQKGEERTELGLWLPQSLVSLRSLSSHPNDASEGDG